MEKSILTDTIITAKWLAKQDIDEYLIDVFADKWPDGMNISESSILEMEEVGINITLVAEALFSPTVLQSYQRQCLSAKNKHDELVNAADEMLDEILAPAIQVFNNTSIPIEKDCDSLIESAEKKYKSMVSVAKKLCPANEMSKVGRNRRAIIAIAQKEYDGIIEKAAGEYDVGMDALQEVHDKEVSPACQVYYKTIMAAEGEYSKAKASVFVKCCQEDS